MLSYVAAATVGIIGAVVGAAASSGLAYIFWKRQHAIEAALTDARILREMRLAITDRVNDIITELLCAASGNAANPAFARQRQITLLKGMREPMKRLFSDRVVMGFDAMMGMEAHGQLQSAADYLIPLMYDESLK
jgi:hypothetical protein